MNALAILGKPGTLSWDYDQGADVLSISIGKPQRTFGVDVGDELRRRYAEAATTVVGLAVIGARNRLIRASPARVPMV